ncbi:MAG: 16S rRNA (cytosine(1402)-N(4))-methyltransferase, partial [Bdellovibrionales bacterium]|nr:16S rRNA (cytosine(1402)-N(4))-methyltransferase [Bdellovibrionales bacterium]
QATSAATIIHESALPDLIRILKEGGLKKEARQVASAIVAGRPFENTKAFADCVRPICERFERGKQRDAATLVFQAIRMAVNEERSQIIALLELVPGIVVSGGKFVCISFHSNEDALVAKVMRKWQGSEQMPALHPDYRPAKVLGTLHSKKALVPSTQELAENVRSRSARMRVFEFF